MKTVTAFKKGKAYALYAEGYSARRIAELIGVPRRTVDNWVLSGFPLERKKGSGRKSKLSARQSRMICRTALRNPTISLSELKTCVNVSKQTVARVLSRNHICSRKRKCQIILTAEQKKKRLDWAMRFCLYRVPSWRRIVFSDESRVSLHTKDGRLRLWIRSQQSMPAHQVVPLEHSGGGGLLIWGAIWFGGRSELKFFRTTMNSERYLDLIESHVYPLSEQLGDPSVDWTFMDDNAPPHRSHLVTAYKALAGIRTLKWPAKSPDLNPIENIWSLLKLKVRRQVAHGTTLIQLEEIIKEAWASIPQEAIDNLVQGMSSRVQKLLASRGDIISSA